MPSGLDQVGLRQVSRARFAGPGLPLLLATALVIGLVALAQIPRLLAAIGIVAAVLLRTP